MYLGIVSGSCSSGVLSMLGSELVGSSFEIVYRVGFEMIDVGSYYITIILIIHTYILYSSIFFPLLLSSFQSP